MFENIDSSFVGVIYLASLGIGIYCTYLFIRLCEDVHVIKEKMTETETEE